MSAKCRGRVRLHNRHAAKRQRNSFTVLQCCVPTWANYYYVKLQVPAGVLYVKLIEATNVPNMDIFSKTDPFVKLWVRKRNERRSRTIFNSLHPRCVGVHN